MPSRLEKMSLIEFSVLTTILYFDIFDYPLTSWEVWKFLYFPNTNLEHPQTSYGDIEKILSQSSLLKDYIAEKNGFWFMAGRDGISDVRRQRYRVAQLKMRKFIRSLRFITLIPFIRGVFITNTLSYNNSREQSDIDLFVICREEKVWSVRFVLNTLLTILGMRPGQGKTNKNRLCINFFVSENALGLKQITLHNKRQEVVDIHLAHIVNFLLPIYDPDEFLKKFEIENDWTLSFFPNHHRYLLNSRRAMRLGIIGRSTRHLLEWCFCSAYFEKKAQKYQMKIMPKELREASEQGTSVVFSSNLLKFHPHDKRRDILQEFNSRYKKLFSEL